MPIRHGGTAAIACRLKQTRQPDQDSQHHFLITKENIKVVIAN
jgi:hypothetical protein